MELQTRISINRSSALGLANPLDTQLLHSLKSGIIPVPGNWYTRHKVQTVTSIIQSESQNGEDTSVQTALNHQTPLDQSRRTQLEGPTLKLLKQRKTLRWLGHDQSGATTDFS